MCAVMRKSAVCVPGVSIQWSMPSEPFMPHRKSISGPKSGALNWLIRSHDILLCFRRDYRGGIELPQSPDSGADIFVIFFSFRTASTFFYSAHVEAASVAILCFPICGVVDATPWFRGLLQRSIFTTFVMIMYRWL